MNKKIGLCDVKVEWLNKRALVLISIFAHAANKNNGTVVDLRADDVLCTISEIAKTSDSAELASIYQRIKREIKVSLSEAETSEQAAREVAKLSVFETPAEVRNRYRPL